MSLQTVLEKLRSKRAVEQASEWQEYKRKVLLPLARSEEVDADECQVFMDRLGIDEQKLRSDVELLQRRLTAKAQLDLATQNAVRMRNVELQIESLDREFARVRTEYTQKIEPLVSERNLLLAASSPQFHENDLQNNIQDPDLIAALARNLEARKSLYPRRAWLQTQLTRNADGGQTTVCGSIAHIEHEIEQLGSAGSIRQISDALLQHVTGDRSVAARRQKLAELQEELIPLFEERDQYQAELVTIDSELAALDRENRRLAEQALEP